MKFLQIFELKSYGCIRIYLFGIRQVKKAAYSKKGIKQQVDLGETETTILESQHKPINQKIY